MIGTDAPIFGRLITAMVTPFDKEGKLDLKGAEKVANHLIKTGSGTILLCGTTGENPTLNDDEKLELLQCIRSLTKNRCRLIMGVGTNNTEASVKWAQTAQREGADGLLVVAPYYNKPSQAGIEAHITKIANSSNLPIVVYNIPGRTGVNITPDTMIKIANACENVHALKDSSGNVDQAAEIAAATTREKFRIYSGDDYLTLPFLAVGACGVISVASHVVGEQMSQMMAKFFSGDVDGPRSIHYKYLPLFKGLFAAPNPSCVKYALHRMGICQEYMRLPLVPLNLQEREVMDKLLKEMGLIENLSYA